MMRCLYLAGREISYARNDVLLRALERFCEVDILGVRSRPASLAAISASLTLQAIPRLLFGQYDFVFVGFYGHLLMLPVGIFSRRPIVFDALLSTYDTLIEDRQALSKRSWFSALAWWLDRVSCRLATLVLLDTPLHIDYFVNQFNLPVQKFVSIPVGCNEDIFYPRPAQKPSGPTIVTYYTSYNPLHGVDVVVRAAALLRSAPIHFRIIGNGLTYPSVRRLAEELSLENISFLPEMPIEQIADEVANADICLGGHFGQTDKAARVVAGKVYQILAMERPVIASTTPANLELLRHGETAYLCLPGDPAALAESIRILHADPKLRFSLAKGGRKLYEKSCSEAVIAEMLQQAVRKRLH